MITRETFLILVLLFVLPLAGIGALEIAKGLRILPDYPGITIQGLGIEETVKK